MSLYARISIGSFRRKFISYCLEWRILWRNEEIIIAWRIKIKYNHYIYINAIKKSFIDAFTTCIFVRYTLQSSQEFFLWDPFFLRLWFLRLFDPECPFLEPFLWWCWKMRCKYSEIYNISYIATVYSPFSEPWLLEP